MGVDLAALIDEDPPELGPPQRYSHIIDRGESGLPVDALLTTAITTGMTLTALCGYSWVPTSHAPEYKVCPTCADVHEQMHDISEVG